MSLRGFFKRTAVLATVMVLLLSAVPLTVSAAYENTYANTGNQARDIVGVAKTQIGYEEGSNNYNKYGAYFDYPNTAWCGFFVAWCARQAGIPTSVIPNSGIASDFGVKGTYHKRNSGYAPQEGDLMLYGSREDAYHVSIVEKYVASTETVYVIDGNWSDKVSAHSTTLDDGEVAGFITPNYTRKVTELTLLNAVPPTVIVKGNTFPVTGNLYSPNKITAASVSVVNASGKTVTSNKGTPNAKEYDLSKLNAGVKFGTLSAGSYKYVIAATDTEETKKWTYNFTVAATATVKLTDVIVPSTVKKGTAFSIGGNFECNEPLLSVFFGVYTAGGTYKTGGTAQPETLSFDLGELDPYVSFGSLPVGSYVIKISMRSNHLKETWEYPFEVTTGETFSLRGVTYPTQLDVGEAFNVTGKVVCSAKMTAVTINLIDENGKKVSTATASPNATSYSLSALDSKVPFSQLKKGHYTYRIAASTGSSSYEWRYEFVVGTALKGDLDASDEVDMQDALILYNYVNGTTKLTEAEKSRIGVSNPDMLTSLRLYNYASGTLSKYL